MTPANVPYFILTDGKTDYLFNRHYKILRKRMSRGQTLPVNPDEWIENFNHCSFFPLWNDFTTQEDRLRIGDSVLEQWDNE